MSSPQAQLKLPPETDFQKALKYPCHIVTDAEGNTVIKIEQGAKIKDIPYPYSPLSLVEAFSHYISRDDWATKQSAMILTCLSAYRSIAKQVKQLANPDQTEPFDSPTSRKKAANDFCSKITSLEEELESELAINLKIFIETVGTDILECILDYGEDGKFILSNGFLDNLHQAVEKHEVPEKREGAFQHFALRVQSVLTHIHAYEREEALVVSNLLRTAKGLVEKVQDPIAGAVYLQANIHHFKAFRPNDRHNHTELLLTAQQIGQVDNDFPTALLLSSPAEQPFLARAPLTNEILDVQKSSDYLKCISEAMQTVSNQLKVSFDDLWKVFSTLEKQGERQKFFAQIIANPQSFRLYQLNLPNPVADIQIFIDKYSEKKEFYLDQSKSKISLGKDANGNTTLIDLVAVVSSRVSPTFLKQHKSPESSLPLLLEKLQESPSFLKIFNLFCNKTETVEILFDSLFTSFRAGEDSRFLALLSIAEQSENVGMTKKLLAKLNQQ